MNLKKVKELLDAKVICGDLSQNPIETHWAVAADLMSNIMLDAPDGCILITGLVNPQVIRTAEMMNVGAIVLVKGKTATKQMISLADQRGIVLMETNEPMFTACGKLYKGGLSLIDSESSAETSNSNFDLKTNISHDGDSKLPNGPMNYTEHEPRGRLISSKNTAANFNDTTGFHSVILDPNKCNGCTHCVQDCPTEAIRIRNGKAIIISNRCIDCGQCIKVCPQHAKRSITDNKDLMKLFKYKVAVVSPAILGQFKDAGSRNHLLTAIKNLGFDKIVEESAAAELISQATRQLLERDFIKKPLISSACPAILKLIQVRFPNLIDHVLPFESPMELAAKLIKDSLAKTMNRSDIGVFFLTPCVAKAAKVKEPIPEISSEVDAIIPINDIYVDILNNLNKLSKEDILDLETSGIMGIRWAKPGGESLALGTSSFLAVDGIQSAIGIFEELDDDKISGVEFIEALACEGGCIGGPLTIENVYASRTTMKKFEDEAKEKHGNSFKYALSDPAVLNRSYTLEYKPVMQLDSEIGKAMEKMEEMNRIIDSLPGVDCGACGAPNCRALAEDIVRGKAKRSNCLFKMWDIVQALEDKVYSLEKENKELKNSTEK